MFWCGLTTMKNAYELLREKEDDLSRVRYELECLRLVISLMDEDEEDAAPAVANDQGTADEVVPPETGTEGPRGSSEGKFWSFGKRRRP